MEITTNDLITISWVFGSFRNISNGIFPTNMCVVCQCSMEFNIVMETGWEIGTTTKPSLFCCAKRFLKVKSTVHLSQIHCNHPIIHLFFDHFKPFSQFQWTIALGWFWKMWFGDWLHWFCHSNLNCLAWARHNLCQKKKIIYAWKQYTFVHLH